MYTCAYIHARARTHTHTYIISPEGMKKVFGEAIKHTHTHTQNTQNTHTHTHTHTQYDRRD